MYQETRVQTQVSFPISYDPLITKRMHKHKHHKNKELCIELPVLK